MKFFFNPILPLLFITCTAYSQPIYFSNNKMTHSENCQYKIVGNVNGNIIVWETILNKKHHSRIYIYDHSMQLISKVSTKILSSSIEPSTQFYNAGNMFYVAYRYKDENTFSYKLASFNAAGSLQSIKILDSLNVKNQSIINQVFFYKLLQSNDGKTICFNKMSYDSVHYVLKFNCSFITGNEINYKDFVIPFDAENEAMADIIVDNNKNVLILEASKNGEMINVHLVKQKFAGNEMLMADKSINAYVLENYALHIAEKQGGYLVFSALRKDSAYEHSVYIWQTDYALNDFSGDAVINKQSLQNDRISYTTAISTNEKFSSVFATWNVQTALYPNGDNNAGNYFAPQDIDPHSVFESYPLNYQVERTITGIYLPPYYNRVNDNNSAKSQTILPVHQSGGVQLVANKIELFRLNNDNKTIWNNTFSDSVDNATEEDFGGARIIAGNKFIHIIYQVVISKKTKTLGHISIKPDGTFTRNFFAVWDTKYNYSLDDCIITDKNELIIPVTNGVKIKFVKTSLQ